MRHSAQIESPSTLVRVAEASVIKRKAVKISWTESLSESVAQAHDSCPIPAPFSFPCRFSSPNIPHASATFLLTSSIPKGGLIPALVTIGDKHNGAASHISCRILRITSSTLSGGIQSAFVIMDWSVKRWIPVGVRSEEERWVSIWISKRLRGCLPLKRI